MARNSLNEDELLGEYRDLPETLCALSISVYPGWTDTQKKAMVEYTEFCHKQIEYIKECWKNGPSRNIFPTPPDYDIAAMLKNDSSLRGKTKGRRVKQTKKTEILAVKSMSDSEFNEYLKSKLVTDYIPCPFTSVGMEWPAESLEYVAVFIVRKWIDLKNKDGRNLSDHLDFGQFLNAARKRFNTEKREHKLKMTWKNWTDTNTGISEAYVRQHIEIARLVRVYPKLRNLAITYLHLFLLKGKILSVFTRNLKIANWWEVK